MEKNQTSATSATLHQSKLTFEEAFENAQWRKIKTVLGNGVPPPQFGKNSQKIPFFLSPPLMGVCDYIGLWGFLKNCYSYLKVEANSTV